MAGSPNLLRNGSFEGALLYWHNVSEEKHRLVDDAKSGQYALRIDGDWVASAPIPMEKDATYAVSFWAKAEGEESRVSISVAPTAREVAVKAGRIWTKGAGKSVAVDGEWKRYSVTFPADVPTTGFWPQPHYMVVISGAKDKPVLVDGMTVTRGETQTADYVGRAAVEVVVECTNLPGFRGAAGNVFNVGETAQMVAYINNPSDEAQTVLPIWQTLDYEAASQVGLGSVGDAIKLPAGETVAIKHDVPLDFHGLALAQVIVVVANAENVAFDTTRVSADDAGLPDGRHGGELRRTVRRKLCGRG